MDEEKNPTPPDSGDENHGKETPASELAAGEPSAEGATPEEAAAAKPQPSAEGKPPPRRPARPPRKKGPVYEDLEEGDLVESLKEYLGEDLLSAQSFLKQNIYTVSRARLLETMVFLKEDRGFDYLVDLTALDYLGDDDRWCLVYHLFSHASQLLARVKSRLGEGEVAPSVTSIWKSADWMEREVFDMFGIEFRGHPDLKRILLPEDWHGHPLRKDYDIKLQDQSWIDKHLKIRKVPD